MTWILLSFLTGAVCGAVALTLISALIVGSHTEDFGPHL